MHQIRSRLAPTPSGYLHKGNAFNFLLASRLVSAAGGRMVLRIDDLDSNRTRPEYLADVFETLHWLGISWHEGPQHAAEVPDFSQHTRLPLYDAYLQSLRAGGHLFACECSRKLLQHYDQYPGTCLHKNLPFSEDLNWRLVTTGKPVTFTDRFQQTAFTIDLNREMRHPVIRKKDGLPAYQLASLADDVHMRIDTVVRGKDLLPSTAVQLYLAALLGLDSFRNAAFYHHPLIASPAGGKLSKSAGSFSIREYRKTHTAEELMNEFETWRSGVNQHNIEL